MPDVIISDKRFAGEAHRITEWITPNAVDVLDVFSEVAATDPKETLLNCWRWINDNIAYPTDPIGRTVDSQELISFGALRYINSIDFWQWPCETIARAKLARSKNRKALGDCDDVAFAFVSIMRNQLSLQDAYCVIGYYNNDKPSGHAWAKCRLDGAWYIIDLTVQAGSFIDLSRYDEYLYFNDMETHELKPIEVILGSAIARC